MKVLDKSLFVLGFIVLLTSQTRAQSIDHVIENMINKVSVENLSEHIQILEDAGGTRNRVTFTSGVDSAAVYIKKQFDSIPGLTSVEYDTFYISTATVPYNLQPQVNVVATIAGSTYPEQSYVIGAHIDATADRDNWWGNQGANWQSIQAPGADDNATGVAAILEIARIMADPDSDFSTDYTIKLIGFGAEERLPATIFNGTGTPSNHHGSSHYANRARDNNEDILGMISLDMIGFNDHNDYTSFVYHGTSYDLNQRAIAIGEEYVRVNDRYDIGLITNSSPFAQGNYSDHRSFAVDGFPALLVIENAAPWNRNQYYTPNPYYHRSDDTFDKLNMGLVKKVAQLNLATLASFGGRVTSTHDAIETPRAFYLNQNYPNPFSSRTEIEFDLPESGFVDLKVYDMLGNEIAELMHGVQAPGRHTVSFDTNNLGLNLASGVYTYRLVTNDFVESRKMVLVK